MRFVDGDAHVLESDQTWEYMDPTERHFRPQTWRNGDTGAESWVVLDQRVSRLDRVRSTDPHTRSRWAHTYPPGAADLSDVSARISHMDDLNIGVQVVISSFFTLAHIERPLVEAALARSYNRWIAERCAESRGRLVWLMIPPLRMLDRAFEEMDFAKQHGAVGIMLRGELPSMVLDDEYFTRLYAKAQDLDLALCVHVFPPDWRAPLLDPRGTFPTVTSVINGFHRIAVGSIHDRFPRLRWGFLEAGASWLPFVLHEAARATEFNLRRLDDNIEVPSTLLSDRNLYVACQIDDDIPYLLQYAGPDNLIVGTDYSHIDLGADVDACSIIANRSDLKPEVAQKIAADNGRRLYALGP